MEGEKAKNGEIPENGTNEKTDSVTLQKILQQVEVIKIFFLKF